VEAQTDLVKDDLHAPLRQGGALDVLDCAEFACEALAILHGDGPVSLLRELVDDIWILPQIELRADEEARRVGAEVPDLRELLPFRVRKRGLRREAEADKEDVCIAIRQWA
jgi:hypothetical protein